MSSDITRRAVVVNMGGDKERGENGSVDADGVVATPFEDAVAMTGLGRFHHVLLAVCGMCLVSMIFETLSSAYIIPAARCDFDMSSFEKGFLSGTIYVGMMLSSHMWGFVADTRGRHLVLSLSLAVNFLLSLVAAFMPTLPLLIAVRFFNGVCVCGPSAVTYAYLGEFHSDRTRTQSIVYVCIFMAFGLLVQPGLAWLVIPQPWNVPLPWITLRSWRVFLIIGALPSIVTFLALVFLLPESPKFLLAAGRHDEALDVLRKMFTTNNGLPSEKYPVVALQPDALSASAAGVNTKSPAAIARHMWRQTAPLFKPPYLLYTLIACVTQFGLYSSSNGFLLWLPELLNRVGQYNAAYPDHPTTVCDAIAVLTGRVPPPVAVEFAPFNHSSMADVYPGTEKAITSDWTNSDKLLSISANWTGAILESFATNSSVNAMVESVSANFSTVVEPCVATVSAVSFQNSLITGAGFVIAYTAISPVVKWVNKKVILAVSLSASGACGVAVLWAQSELQILVLPLAFIVFSGMCVGVVNTVVVDIVPTYLRAMAVCLSLCCGRLGAFITSLMLGALIDSSCVVAISILGGFIICCGLLSLVLPSEAKLKKMRQ